MEYEGTLKLTYSHGIRGRGTLKAAKWWSWSLLDFLYIPKKKGNEQERGKPKGDA